ADARRQRDGPAARAALHDATTAPAALHEGTADGYGRAASRTDQPPIALVAIPTTYAGSEMTPLYGVTRSVEDRKVTTTEPRVLPALVLYDPELTLDLPPELTAGTGVNALRSEEPRGGEGRRALWS